MCRAAWRRADVLGMRSGWAILAAVISAQERTVDYCHQHNLVEPDKALVERRYGIRVSLPPGDTFNRILGEDWERVLWFPTEAERDVAFDNMATRHGYYRKTDTPTQVLEKLVR